MINKKVHEYLLRQGFSGKLNEFRKIVSPVIICVNLQEKSNHKEFCINIGVHLGFIPPTGSLETLENLDKITYLQCELKYRVTPEDKLLDYWWDLNNFNDAIEIFEKRNDIEKFLDFPNYYTNIEVEALNNEKMLKLLPGLTQLRAAMFLARIHAELGNKQKCIEFSEFGLSIANAIAVGPKNILKKLIASNKT